MQYLTAADLLKIHSIIIDESGGSHGTRDMHALHTLEELPQQRTFGVELYPDVHIKAALYVRNIIFAHPFVDGNKRTAMTAADVFLQLNSFAINAKTGEVADFAVSVVEKHLDLEQIASWLKKHSRKLK